MTDLIILGVCFGTPLNVSLESIMTDIIKELEKEQLRDETPEFSPGDTVRVL